MGHSRNGVSFYTKILKIQEENENDKHSVKSRE